MLKIKVLKNEDRELELEIFDEDHTLGNLLEKILLEDSSVTFAGYKIPHPLRRSVALTIRTDGSKKPLDALLEAATKASQLSREFREAFNNAVEEYVKKK